MNLPWNKNVNQLDPQAEIAKANSGFPIMTVIILGALGLGAYLVFKK